jgi:hypothetical protein
MFVRKNEPHIKLRNNLIIKSIWSILSFKTITRIWWSNFIIIIIIIIIMHHKLTMLIVFAKYKKRGYLC